jgi:hypothetical protein
MLTATLASLFAVTIAASPVAGTPGPGSSVMLVTLPPPAARQSEVITVQRLAAAIETRLGLRETAQGARTSTDPRVACPAGIDYVLSVDAATIRPMSGANQLEPRLSATLTRCADGSAVSASHSAGVAGTVRLDDPAVTKAYRTLEPLVIDDLVERVAASKRSSG